jgi:hypothetical protein
MKFRARNANGNAASTMQIWLCAFWIVLSAFNLHRDMNRHHRYDAVFHAVCLFIFVSALALHIYLFFSGSITLDEETLTFRQSLRPLTLPYAAIVDAQPAFTPAGKMLTHMVELEIARVAPDIYPHEYRKVYLSDPDDFLEALRPHLTQTV